MSECGRTMESTLLPDHVHLCLSKHTTGDHICAECGRRFGKR